MKAEILKIVESAKPRMIALILGCCEHHEYFEVCQILKDNLADLNYPTIPDLDQYAEELKIENNGAMCPISKMMYIIQMHQEMDTCNSMCVEIARIMTAKTSLKGKRSATSSRP